MYLTVERLIWVLQQWASFKCWVDFENNHARMERNLSFKASQDRLDITRKYFFFLWSRCMRWCLPLVVKGNTCFPSVTQSADFFLHPCREQEPMRKCWLKFLPPEHLLKCGILNRFICKVKFSIKLSSEFSFQFFQDDFNTFKKRPICELRHVSNKWDFVLLSWKLCIARN